MDGTIQKIITIILCLLSSFSYANYGMRLSYILKAKEPDSLHGAQLMLTASPASLFYKQFNLYFDGGFSHFYQTNTSYYSTLNIYSAAPVLRYSFTKRGWFLPYIEGSIGLAYLNHTRIEHRKLGIHFAFQDRIGLGTSFGPRNQFSLGIHSVHYSNAHLSQHNSGVTIPLMLDLGYVIQ